MPRIFTGKKWDRPKLIQNFVSSAMGLLIAADVMSLRVPLYFFGQATDRVGDVFHSVARLVRHGLSDIFDQIETGSITVSDALDLAWTGRGQHPCITGDATPTLFGAHSATGEGVTDGVQNSCSSSRARRARRTYTRPSSAR